MASLCLGRGDVVTQCLFFYAVRLYYRVAVVRVPVPLYALLCVVSTGVQGTQLSLSSGFAGTGH